MKFLSSQVGTSDTAELLLELLGSEGPRGGPLTARLSRRGGRAQASVVWCCVGLFLTLTVPARMQAFVGFHFSSCRHAHHWLLS